MVENMGSEKTWLIVSHALREKNIELRLRNNSVSGHFSRSDGHFNNNAWAKTANRTLAPNT